MVPEDTKTSPKKLKVLVIGGGAVGLGLTSFLVSAGCDVSLAARPKTVDAVCRQGIVRSGIKGGVSVPRERLQGVGPLIEFSSWAGDLICICVKCYDTREVIETLRPWVEKTAGRALAVLFQNGWGTAEVAARVFPRERIYCARVITGFVRTSLSAVTMTVHADDVRIGSPFSPTTDSRIEVLAQCLTQAGWPARTTRRIQAYLWAKLIYNAMLNPLGALLGVPYGALGESSATRAIMEAIAAEAFQVLKAQGVETLWPACDDFLKDFYAAQLPRTAQHESSMLQDLRQGRRTEIDFINGAVVRLAKDNQMDVPVNRTMTHLVAFQEQRG